MTKPLRGKSFKAEVVADDSGQFVSNALRFKTASEAQKYGHNLMMRWTAVRDVRVVPDKEKPNYRWDDKNREQPL